MFGEDGGDSRRRNGWIDLLSTHELLVLATAVDYFTVNEVGKLLDSRARTAFGDEFIDALKSLNESLKLESLRRQKS